MNSVSGAATELPVLPSCRETASRSALIFFHPEKIAHAIARWGRLLNAAPSWDHPCHFFDGTDETVRWIFTLDVLNHCFWPDPGEPVWTIRYKDEDWSGYWALAAGLKRAMEAGYAVTDPLWLSQVSEEDLERIFSYPPPPAPPARGGVKTGPTVQPARGGMRVGPTVQPPRGGVRSGGIPLFRRQVVARSPTQVVARSPDRATGMVESGAIPLSSETESTHLGVRSGGIPLFPERLRNLREAGSIILSQLGGDVMSLIESAAGSAVRLVLNVADHFPSFRDEAQYGGARVFFLKRAQIFAADVYTAFGGKGPGNFNDIGALTAFADYKLPQVLRELGIISYNRELAEKVDGLSYLEPGSGPEVEIRAMTIMAVEEITRVFESVRREEVREARASGGADIAAGSRSHQGVTSAQVDSWLWQLGQFDEFRKRPYHRCRTIYY